MTELMIILGIVGILFFAFVSIYNKIIEYKNDVKGSEKQIDVALDERSKKYDSLISVFKKYMKHENETLTEIVKLRSKISSIPGAATHNTEKKGLENELSAMMASGALNQGLSIAVEAYPELKSQGNAEALQEEIIHAEAKLAASKVTYNYAVEEYQTAIESFFSAMVVNMMRAKLYEKFDYWQLEEEDKKEKEAYTMKDAFDD